MSDSEGPAVPDDDVEVADGEPETVPTWAWWLGGVSLLVIILLVWAAVANATPEETAPLPEPSVTASASPSPSPSPSATPPDSPTPMPSPTDVPEPSDSPTPMPSPTDVPEPSDSPTPMPSPTDIPTPPSTFGEGKIVVGTDAAAGTYRVSKAVTEGCVWALKAQGSDRGRDRVSEIIVGGIPTVTLNDGDTFSSKRCGTWNTVDPATLFKNANAAVAAKPGVWLVGEDVKVGTWSTANLGETNDPSKVCKWTVTEKLANNFTTVVTRGVIFSGTGKVSVTAGQQFESTHCGDWTLLSK